MAGGGWRPRGSRWGRPLAGTTPRQFSPVVPEAPESPGSRPARYACGPPQRPPPGPGLCAGGRWRGSRGRSVAAGSLPRCASRALGRGMGEDVCQPAGPRRRPPTAGTGGRQPSAHSGVALADFVDPAVGVGALAVLDAHEFFAQLEGYRAGGAVADDPVAAGGFDPADGGDHGGGAAGEDLGQLTCLTG